MGNFRPLLLGIICMETYLRIGANIFVFLKSDHLDTYHFKGQLISKGLFAILNSSKKRTKTFDLTTMISQVDMFSFVFRKNLKTRPKRHFEINWPLVKWPSYNETWNRKIRRIYFSFDIKLWFIYTYINSIMLYIFSLIT